MVENLFPGPPAAVPRIYAYRDCNPQYAGLLKIGYTTRNAATRIAEQYPQHLGKPYEIVFNEPALRSDGTDFNDHAIHRKLKSRKEGKEWYRCGVEDVRAAYIAVLENKEMDVERTQNFVMRPEQVEAVRKTADYFREPCEENESKRFLWNAKMRFGKTFASYQLAKEMGWKRVLVLTFKPAVQSAWEEDIKTHTDFEGWQFISRDNDLTYENCDKDKPVVCFGSFQDYLGVTESGAIKVKNEWVHAVHWDCVMLDEYHFGAWRESARDLVEGEQDKAAADELGEALDYYEEGNMPITANYYLYLSGTPFRALTDGEFLEDQIFNWTYSDEQKAKENRSAESGPNPYAALPKMVLLTYKLPQDITGVIEQTGNDEFDLNVFFAAEGSGKNAKFKREDDVQKWLSLIRGSFRPAQVDAIREGNKRPPMPFSHAPLLSVLNHTVWFMPNVAACYAMKNLLESPQNAFYHDYKIVAAAGTKAGIGLKALPPVYKAMANPLDSKSITLTCGKLTTGVTVRPWTGIFMLRNCSSPETYFQAAFRVQSPWTVEREDRSGQDILKLECYVFDFAPNRALTHIVNYSSRLDMNDDSSPEQKIEEFVKFLPVLSYDGSGMRPINASQILEIATSNTTATLLARRWQSALLVNVDDNTLKRLLNSEDALAALAKIEAFRTLNQDLETIINRSEALKKAKKEKGENEHLEKEEKKELSDEEKDIKSLRKQVQDKLVKFAARIPIFMYLSDFRERCLKDVITKCEPGLFTGVTGLTIKDFELLVSLGIFNDKKMNEAVAGFKRYEDASLNYTGICKYDKSEMGLWDTSIHDKSKVGLWDTSIFHQELFNEEAD
ncbi:MAG: GIY-YIG nuclease family protein [Phycisphaerae bacterium]